MQFTTIYPMRNSRDVFGRGRWFGPRSALGLLGLLASLIPLSAPAADLSAPLPASAQSLAFARYIASIQEHNPFIESGPVAVEIEASLPNLYKGSRLLAIRQTGESERSEYQVLRIEGDGTVVQEVIARYLAVQEQIEGLPTSSVAITPANYKFRYTGEVKTGRTSAYIYQIVPKKRREGLILGQVWIDAATGTPVLQAGRFIKTPSFKGRIEIVRDTKLLNRLPYARVTHVAIEIPQLGRGELMITEYLLTSADEEGGTLSLRAQ